MAEAWLMLKERFVSAIADNTTASRMNIWNEQIRKSYYRYYVEYLYKYTYAVKILAHLRVIYTTSILPNMENWFVKPTF